MESFDLKIAGVDAVLYTDGATLRIEEDGRVLVDTDHVLSAGIISTWKCTGLTSLLFMQILPV